MRHFLLTRSAYGPCWDPEANRRRLELTRGITIPSVRAQAGPFDWLVLLHRDDALHEERRAAFAAAGAQFLYTDEPGTPQHVAWVGYRSGWAEAIGPRRDVVAMTRLDDDDALAPWVFSRIRSVAPKVRLRSALMCPMGVRVWRGAYTVVRHDSNAMHTLVTPPGDAMVVYDYMHRKVRRVAMVRMIDKRPAWLWVRHPDTISGWREAARPLTDGIRDLFPTIDWTLLDGPPVVPARHQPAHGRYFR